MKHKRFLFLLTAAVAFIIQLIDIISYTIKFSITQTFVLVIIQMIGLVGYAYDARNVVKNKRRMFTILHSIAFIIYLINLTYQLFLNPALRHVKAFSSVNISPLKTILLYYTAYERHTFPIILRILFLIWLGMSCCSCLLAILYMFYSNQCVHFYLISSFSYLWL